MKHFELKNFLGGAGGKKPKPPKPPVLQPPYLGEYKNVSSYSYSEVIDLLSDGPIEGLTNKDGYLLKPESYLQGVYLNDVPVEVSSNSFVTSSNQSTNDDTNQVLITEQCLFDRIKNGIFGFAKNVSPNFKSKTNHFTIAQVARTNTSYYDEERDKNIPLTAWRDGLLQNIMFNPALNSCGTTEVNSKLLKIYRGVPYVWVDGCYWHYERERSGYTNGGVTVFSIEDTIIQGSNYISNPRRAGQVGRILNYSAPIFYQTCNPFYFESFFAATQFRSSDDSLPYLDEGNMDSSIGRVVEILTTSSFSRFEKELLKEKLVDLGLDLGSPDENFNYSITKTQLKNLIKQTGSVTYPYYHFYRTSYGDFGGDFRYVEDGTIHKTYVPYVFYSVSDEDKVMDGYNQSLHEDLFINQKYKDITLYDSLTQYSLGNIFAYNGKYYQVVDQSGWLQSSNANRTPDQEIDPPNVNGWIPKLILYFLDEPEVNFKNSFQFKSTSEKPIDNNDVNFDLIIPQLDQNGKWNGKLRGFDLQYFISSINTFSPTTSYDEEQEFSLVTCSIALKNSYMDYYSNAEGLHIVEKQSSRSLSISANKFNFSNVLMEFREGQEFQKPLGFFKDINIDHFYEDQLLGPFSTQQKDPFLYTYDNVQTLENDTDLKKVNGIPNLNFDSNKIPDMDANFLIAYEETSKDSRTSGGNLKNYSSWDNARDFNESAQPVTHIVQNPNVKSCFISLFVRQLQDVYEDSHTFSGRKIDPGSRKPTVVNLKVEVGLVKADGKMEKFNDRFFQIVALIESPTIIDLGSPDSLSSADFYSDVREVSPYGENDSQYNEQGLYTPFLLPEITQKTETDTEFREDGSEKRYIKITKLSTETESSLIRKDVELLKVTEIIESTCTYPLSSIIGIKTDSRVFGEVPKRTYKCKLKKVKIPSNYYPIQDNGKDKRYYGSVTDFVPSSEKSIYTDDWDGSFKFGWTDNPAWILYDMLTSSRYGLGDQISEEQVNKWDLYKIGRFCDAVDKDGDFVGVSDGRGGLEPRFSCNILFSQGINVFDAVNSISAIFRGIVYFDNSSISFSDDRIKEPMALFSNSNVKDGFFAYSSARRDEKYNAVEVSYKDKNDSYKSKIEYVENEDDIAKRGLFKKEIIAVGITSKAMAIRAAKHVMYQTTKEDETISFSTGTEALLCKPGDLILVEDELKTLNTNFGRVLDIDHINGTVRTSDIFKASDYNTTITLYIPSGNQTQEEIDLIASENDGLTEDQISVSSTKQIKNFKITGWGGYSGIQSKEYGDIVYLDKNDVNYNLLGFVPEGTTYRFDSKSYEDQVYKIQTIREEENHSYNIIANKYDSGKYSIIENEINIESEEDVFGYDQLQYTVKDVTYVTLQTPAFESQQTGVNDSGIYQIDLAWTEVEKATGYNLSIASKSSFSSFNLEENNLLFDTDGSFGIYSVKVKALADNFNNNDYNTRYNNSEYESITIEAGDPDQVIEQIPQAEGGGVE